MVSSLSRPPTSAGGTLMNSMEGVGAPCRERQPLRRMQKKRRRALFRARLFEAASAAVFSFQRLNRRKQTRLGQGAKRVNGILGGAVCSARQQSCKAHISWHLLHPTATMLHLPAFHEQGRKPSKSASNG